MIATATIAPAQKLKAAFSDDQGHTIHMDYNGLQDSFRIRYQAMQRLFFFEADGFQKLVLQNEYGVTIGQIVPSGSGAGALRVDTKHYRFALTGNSTTLSLTQGRTKRTLLSCNIAEAPLAQTLNGQHAQHFIYCLAFAFAWALQ